MTRNRSSAGARKSGQRQPGDQQPFSPAGPAMSPGDEAPAGTPGTGENICRACAGKGLVNDRPCPECNGSGYVITGIGGA